jgi:hypothetical protein
MNKEKKGKVRKRKNNPSWMGYKHNIYMCWGVSGGGCYSVYVSWDSSPKSLFEAAIINMIFVADSLRDNNISQSRRSCVQTKPDQY